MKENEDKIKRKNFGLSREEFDVLLNSLKSGDDELFERIFVYQIDESINILRTKYNQSYEDGYDATIETLVRFRKMLIQGKLEYGNLRYMFNRMATFFVLEKMRSKKEFSNDALELLKFETEVDSYSDDHIFKLKEIWKKLNHEERELLHLHYNLDMRLIDIAVTLNLSESAVRKRKQRILEKLRKSLL